MFAFRKIKLRYFNVPLVAVILMLSITGIMIIKSATMSTGETSTYTKQIMGTVMGFGVMLFVSMIDYHWITKMYWMVFLGITGILFLTRFSPLGTNAGTGAYRWLDIGVRIQPSEFAKVAIIIILAQIFSVYAERIDSIFVIGFSLLALGIPLMLILAQPDLSTSIVICFIFVIMIFAARISYKWVVGVMAVAIPSFILIIYLVEENMLPFLEGYQKNRILSFIHPQDYPDLARQQLASIMAIGSGGLMGKGLFNESLDSVKNGNYLMEEDTDFIFAVAGEELGFAGCSIIIALLALLVILCLIVAARAADMQGRLIAAGIAAQFSIQSFVNVGVATFLLPNTGLPLPFISAGLSSLLSVYIGAGMLLNIGMQRQREKDESNVME